MEELKLIVAIASATVMPFVLYILVGIRNDITKLFALIAEHVKEDSAIASRVAIAETQIAHLRKRD